MTLIFSAIFLVWLPGPAAGLQFIGLEMGEWTKFLGVDTRRNWFYLPPITLGLMLVWLTLLPGLLPRRRWLQRALGVTVALLAFPALEDVTGSLRGEYLPRVAAIGLVALAAAGAGVWERWRGGNGRLPLLWAGLLLPALVGLIFPTWIFLLVRPAAAQVMGQPLGIGPGVWLNGAGHLLIILYGGHQLWLGWRGQPADR